MALANYTWREHLSALESFDRPGEHWSFEMPQNTQAAPDSFSETTGSSGFAPRTNGINGGVTNGLYGATANGIYGGASNGIYGGGPTGINGGFDDFEPIYDNRNVQTDEQVVKLVSKSKYKRSISGSGAGGVFVGIMFMAVSLIMFVMIMTLPSGVESDEDLYTGYEKITAEVLMCEQNSTGKYDLLVTYEEDGVTHQTWLNDSGARYNSGSSVTFFENAEKNSFSFTDPQEYLQREQNNNSSAMVGKIMAGLFLSIFFIVGLAVIISSVKKS